MLATLQGYKTIIAFTLAFACALWQVMVGPLPDIDPKQFGLAVTVVGLVMRFLTKTPVGKKADQ